jgi:hypothetical protein
MGNLFYGVNVGIRWDLKGSTAGREYGERMKQEGKDLDFVKKVGSVEFVEEEK